MDPISIILIVILALLFGIMIGVVTSAIVGSIVNRRRFRPQPSVQLIAEQNHICETDTCGSLIRFSVNNPTNEHNAGRDMELTVKRDNDEFDRPVEGVTLGPEFENVFVGTDPRMFYSGSGIYTIGVKLFPASSPGPDRTVKVNVMIPDTGFEIIQTGNTNTLESSVLTETFFADVFNEKATIRTCKGMSIKSLAVYGFTLGPDQFDDDTWEMLRENDGLNNVSYPDEVDIQIETPNGSLNVGLVSDGEYKYFGTAPLGQNPDFPNMIEIVEGLVIKGTRNSGANPFPRFSRVGWKIFIQIDCG